MINRYLCNDPTKKSVDLTDPSSPLYNSVNTTCTVNGNYDVDVTNFACIGDRIFEIFVITSTKSPLNIRCFSSLLNIRSLNPTVNLYHTASS